MPLAAQGACTLLYTPEHNHVKARIREASKKWKRPIRDWKAALNQFVILYGDRVPIEQ